MQILRFKLTTDVMLPTECAVHNGVKNLLPTICTDLTCRAACSAFDPPRPTRTHSGPRSRRSRQGRRRPKLRQRSGVAAIFVAGPPAKSRRAAPLKIASGTNVYRVSVDIWHSTARSTICFRTAVHMMLCLFFQYDTWPFLLWPRARFQGNDLMREHHQA